MENKYNNFIDSIRKEKQRKITNLISEKEGTWLNSQEPIKSGYVCKIQCINGHLFKIKDDILIKGHWCSVCTGNNFHGESLARIILEDVLRTKLDKTRRLKGLIGQTNKKLEIDGYSSTKKIGFEYQGSQHFKYIKYISKSYDNFLKLQENDKIKRDYFKKNNLTLIVVPQFKSFRLDKAISNILELLQGLKLPHKSPRLSHINKKLSYYLKKGKYQQLIEDILSRHQLTYIQGDFYSKDSIVSFYCQQHSKYSLSITKIIKYKNNLTDFLEGRIRRIRVKKIKSIKKIPRKTTKEYKAIRNKRKKEKTRIKKQEKFNLKLMEVIEIISRYTYLNDLRRKEKDIINWLCYYNKYKELTKNLIRTNPKISHNFTFNKVYLIAKKYYFRTHFRDENPGAYEYAKKNKILDKISKHMKPINKK